MESIVAGWVIAGIAVVVLGGLYAWYVVIVVRRNRVAEALAGIDVQLQNRHDLIPNVLNIARRFMDHEKALFAEIVELRDQARQAIGDSDFGATGRRFEAEKQLGFDLSRLFALAEAYPDLKSSVPMVEAQRAYVDVETNLSAARRFYNSAVGDLRTIVEVFPGHFLKRIAGVDQLPAFFETNAAARMPVAASGLL